MLIKQNYSLYVLFNKGKPLLVLFAFALDINLEYVLFLCKVGSSFLSKCPLYVVLCVMVF